MPLNLNEMRTMKDANYIPFRQLITENLANPVLELLKTHSEYLGLDPEVFDLVYEGFWDLYTFHPQCPDLSAKKLL